MTQPSPKQVQELLAQPDKHVMRPFIWQQQASGHIPKIYIFESAVQVRQQVLEGLRFRASYRGQKHISKGMASITLPEKFECALLLGQHRIAALDTNPGQRHFNHAGEGFAWFNQTIASATHRHIWTGTYGYAEPVDPPLLDVLQLITTFAQECRLHLTGTLLHPLHGTQGDLL